MNAEKEYKSQNLSVVKAIKWSVALTSKAVPVGCIIYILFAIAHGMLHGLIAPVSQRLYDSLADLVIGDGLIRDVYIAATLIIGLTLIREITSATHSFFSGVLIAKASGRLTNEIHKKVSTLQAQIFEDKDRLDDIEKAGKGNEGVFSLYTTISDGIFFYGAYFAVMGIFLWNIHPILLLSLLLVFVPEILSQIIRAQIMAKLETAAAPVRRQKNHYEEALIGIRAMKETRLFGTYYFFKKLYMDSLGLLTQKAWNAEKKITVINLVLGAIKAVGWVGVLTLLFHVLAAGNISVGAFAAVFTSMGMMFGAVETILNNIKVYISDNLGKIHNLINLLEIPLDKKEKIAPDFAKGIIVSNITFSYPKTEKPAVNGVSLNICQGETLAIVGENGSGKTTLIKLLSGLYKPDEGSVIVGGCDAATTEECFLFSRTSAVFQFPNWYAFSLAENVSISDINSGESPLEALHHADIDPNDTATFPKGVDTVLMRDFDGVELSGGQWQRVGTARGLYRSYDFIVLDEPTSTIDPMEESRIYKCFAELAKDKIAIIVTHRLGSVRIADRIAVMDGGSIVEIGTHDCLLAQGGKYAEMWETQSASYK